MLRSAGDEATQFAVFLTPLLPRPSYVKREMVILLDNSPVVKGNVCDLVTVDNKITVCSRNTISRECYK